MTQRSVSETPPPDHDSSANAMSDSSPSIRWEAEYKVAPSSADRNLPGDKIILPPSALEALLSAVSLRPSAFREPWDTREPFADTHALPSPLMFRLSNPASGRTMFAGVREFSSDEDQLVLSPFLLKELGLSSPLGEETPTVKVQACQLPKGTYVRFRQLEAGYNPDDWKALLERQLESFTTLTKGTTFVVHGVKGETFELLIDKFAPEGNGICVVDTDAEVEIAPLDEEQARETLRRAVAQREVGLGGDSQSSKGGVLDIWKPVEGQVAKGSYVQYELPSWSRTQPLVITLKCEDGGQGDDIDLFVSPKSARQRALPRAEEHVWSDMSSSSTKTIIIPPSDLEIAEAESIRISVHGYDTSAAAEKKDHTSAPTVRFTLRVRIGSVQSSDTAVTRDSSEPAAESHGPDDELCRNCKRWIPKSTATLHAVFCARNNETCPKCGKVVKRGDVASRSHWHCEVSDDCGWGDTEQSLAKHRSLYHDPSRSCWEAGCTARGLTLPQLAKHRTSTCPGKLILCRFCHLELSQGGDDPLGFSAETLLTGLTPHELSEGNKTTDCEVCGRIVRLRELAAHVKNHDHERENQAKPQICRNQVCGHTLHGTASRTTTTLTMSSQNQSQSQSQSQAQHRGNNSIGLCALCFGPLYVSMHDPDNRALRRRIERRLLTQLMTGCGQQWCRNAWCRTGRLNMDVEPKPHGAAAALAEVRPLLEDVLSPRGSLWFCVDESSQRSRTVAEAIAAEGRWDVEWAVAACEACRGNAADAREWLARHAATKKP